MIFAGLSADKIVALPGAVSVEINQSLDVPADDMTVVFEYSDAFPNISRIYAIGKGCSDIEGAVSVKDVLFSGVVDEVVVSADTSNASITVYARSMAALLLDNECRPQTYVNPDTDVIYKNHLSRFGIESDCGSRAKRSGKLNVFKGYSHYKVLENYCSNFLDSKVRIDHRGVCHTDCFDSNESVDFDNKCGVKFNSVSVSNESYSRISRVLVCTDNSLRYNTVIADDEALNSGIVRERFLNANSDSDYCLSDGDRLIEKGRVNAYTITLSSDERVINRLGCQCTVNTPMSAGKNMVISEIHFVKKAGREKTVLKLTQR